ncbi:hypothetical protein PR202_ga02008 [Eleusine coracana subsp. coracana]|uniref:aldehyde oxygenase (deformylating) n=1 Tax=Eleusine coracana subsp. coracana TaxID=191504 RepID=A0AAV5BHW5_ELECO|nr:hypothetical protein PR202_ga01321 [Eleusine coracana subsp. coracana]GJM86175.1 hypothetical protein PR202_ga02008 [Eleusine coracana subsp. coracana]
MAPVVVHGAHRVATKGWGDIDLAFALILPSLLLRMVHNQIWISIARYQTARSKHRIVDRGIEFEQVDRERGWDDQILLNGLLFYVSYLTMPSTKLLPAWRTDGAVMMALLHAGPVEFLYYWFHRALHHHFLYSRYHSHHHSSIVTEPITSVIHPFAEHIVYYLLFAIPMLSGIYVGNSSVMAIVLYIGYIDFMNNMGHCNFELVPKWMFQAKQINGGGELYRQKYPKLRVRLVDGSGLATAVLLKSIPQDAKQVFLHAGPSKIACATASALCGKGVQVIMNPKKEYDVLKSQIAESKASYLKHSSTHMPQIWLVDNIDDKEQRLAPKQTLFIPISQFPIKKIRKDCTYLCTPAMKIPETMQNIHACENWLPRRVMSAWRIAGILHALEGWTMHECGDAMMDAEKAWKYSACIRLTDLDDS